MEDNIEIFSVCEKPFLEQLKNTENITKENEIKVVVVLKAVGNAPILSTSKIKISGMVRVISLYEYLKKTLKKSISDNESIFIYCNNDFSPPLTTYVMDLYNHYSTSGELIINYAITEAWG